MRLLEEGVDAARHDRAHVGHLQQLVFRGGIRLRGTHDGIERAEVACQVFGGGLAHMANAQAEQETRQGGVFGLLQSRQHVLGGFVGHTVQPGQGDEAQAVQVGQRAHDLLLHQLLHQLVAQAFDVHGPAVGEMQDRLLALRGAEQAAAATVVHLGLLAHHRAAADGALAGHTEVGHIGVALSMRDHGHDFRYHVASAAHDRLVTHPHALAPQLKQVVQRGVGDRHPAHKHRRQPRHGGEFAGAPHLHVDAQHSGDLLLRRIFVGHGPARFARDKAQLALLRQAVDLVNHTVDVKGQLVPRGTDFSVKSYQFRSTLRTPGLGCNRKTP